MCFGARLRVVVAVCRPLGVGLEPATESLVLWPLAVALWASCDRRASTLAVSIATALAGPCFEIFLLGGGGAFGAGPFGHLYQYTNADFLGIDSWISPVYFAGGPAVILLARWLRAKLAT